MADFCLDCFKEIEGFELREEDAVLEWGICEECGQYKDVVVGIRGRGLIDSIMRFITIIKRLLKKKNTD